MKIGKRVEVRTYHPINKEDSVDSGIGRKKQKKNQVVVARSESSYSDYYSEGSSYSLEERVEVKSEESSLEDEDFDFLNSDKFFEYVQLTMNQPDLKIINNK